MSIRFEPEPAFRRLGEREWVVTREFRVEWRGRAFIVFAGFRSDLFSVPSWLRLLTDVPGAEPAALVHDLLYDYPRGLTRAEADALFYDVLHARGVSRWRSWLLWAGVRAFGASLWGPEPGDPPHPGGAP